MRGSQIDINSFDCIQWGKVDTDVNVSKAFKLCLKCSKWYLRLREYPSAICSGCSGSSETVEVRSKSRIKQWSNDTSIVLQQTFHNSKSRSISIPKTIFDAESFSKSLIKKLSEGSTWETILEEVKKRKEQDDQSKRAIPKHRVDEILKAHQSCLDAFKCFSDLVSSLSHE